MKLQPDNLDRLTKKIADDIIRKRAEIVSKFIVTPSEVYFNTEALREVIREAIENT